MTPRDYRILQILYYANHRQAQYYYNASFYEDKALLKCLFEHLYLKKKSFCTALKIVMATFEEHNDAIFFDTINITGELEFESKLFDKKEILKNCYFKEVNAQQTYDRAIEITRGEKIREILLDQRDMLNPTFIKIQLSRLKAFKS